MKRRVYPSVVTKKGNFGKGLSRPFGDVWGHRPLDVFTTDASKTMRHMVRELSGVAPYIQKGALVVLADFVYGSPLATGWIPVYHALVKEGYLELVSVCPPVQILQSPGSA